jgi:hypothetical protein
MEKGVRNLRFLTILVPRRHIIVTYLTLRQLALNNSRFPLFLINTTLIVIKGRFNSILKLLVEVKDI